MGSRQYLQAVLSHYIDTLLSEGSQPLSEDSQLLSEDSQPLPEGSHPLSEGSQSLPENRRSLSEANHRQATPNPTPACPPPVAEAAVAIQASTVQESTIKESTVPSPSAVQVDAYEQQQQRLARMLHQVSLLNTVETASASEAAPVSSSAEAPAQLAPLPEGPTAVTECSEEAYPKPEAVQPINPLSSVWCDNGRPVWAQERFDLLLVDVNGLRLAVPLQALGQIQPLDKTLTPLFGQSEWFMGLQQTPVGAIKTVDTAQFVMPERYQADHQYKYVVSINGLSWGLAVDAVDQPKNVHPNDIRWRRRRTHRPWMAGTVKDQMCVLLDIPALGRLLNAADKPRQ